MIVTSRQRFALPGLHPLRLDTLPEPDAVVLRQGIALQLDEPEARTLAELCGYLPLALRVAGGTLLRQVDLKPARYMERLRAARVKFKEVDAVLAESLALLEEPVRAFWLCLGVMPADFDAPAPMSPLAVAAAQELLSYELASGLGWSSAKLRTR